MTTRSDHLSEHFKPMRDPPDIPKPKVRPTREVPIPNEMVMVRDGYQQERNEMFQEDVEKGVEVQYFEYLPVYQSKVSQLAHSNYISEGALGVVILSLLHPKSLEFARRKQRKERKGLHLKLGGSNRDSRKSYNFGSSSPVIAMTEEEGHSKDDSFTGSKTLRKKNDPKKKSKGLSGFKRRSQAIANKISKKEDSKFDTFKRKKGRRNSSKKVMFDSEEKSSEIADDESISVSVSDVFAEDEESIESDIGFFNQQIEGLVRMESGDVWVKFKTDEPVNKVKQLIKIFKERMPRFANCNFNLIKNPGVVDQLIALEEEMFKKVFTVSVLSRCENQHNFESILNNDTMTPKLKAFLSTIAAKVRLVGWDFFNGGLSTNMFAETGEESYYSTLDDNEIMFHVGPLLPSDISNTTEEQSPRNKFILDNTVVIVFDEGKYPIDPAIFKHDMFQVICLVRKTEDTNYKITFISKSNVREHRPIFPFEGLFEPTDEFTKLFLTKIINATRAASTSAPATAKSNILRHKQLDSLKQLLEEE